MRKLFVLFILLLVMASLSVSAFSAGKPVTYKSGDETIHGVLYAPQGPGPFPGIVVIHEWWGLSDWIKEQASKLADEGYVALAIDLYRGKVATSDDQAQGLFSGLREDRADRDLLAAVAFLRTQNNVNRSRIGAIGWSMGGAYSLQTALLVPDLAAVVIHYGPLETEPEDLQKINAPILGLFGGKDQIVTPREVRKFQAVMKHLNKKLEVHVYPAAEHDFENPIDKAGYRAVDAADAWKRTLSFLDANLKSR